MAFLNKIKIALQSSVNINYNIANRLFSISSRLQLKEIHERQEGSTLIIEGKHVDSSRVPYLVKNVTENNCCPICRTGLDVKHTDVLILSQFLRSDGCVLPRRITGLCSTQQKRVSKLVAMAQKAGLMSILTPTTSKKDPKKRKQWRKFNMYFDESTIKCK